MLPFSALYLRGAFESSSLGSGVVLAVLKPIYFDEGSGGLATPGLHSPDFLTFSLTTTPLKTQWVFCKFALD